MKEQNSAIKIFKIDTLQPRVAPVRHQKLHFLNKNSEAKHFSKIISFKKMKILGKYANKRQSSIHKNLIATVLSSVRKTVVFSHLLSNLFVVLNFFHRAYLISTFLQLSPSSIKSSA